MHSQNDDAHQAHNVNVQVKVDFVNSLQLKILQTENLLLLGHKGAKRAHPFGYYNWDQN